MSRRPARGGNAIRGPQSALTDFLASHNISAAQIRNDYDRRRVAAEANGPVDGEQPAEEEPAEPEEAEEVDIEAQKKKKKRKADLAIAKIKKSKEFQRRKRALAGEPGEDDSDNDLAWDMYAKQKPLPGQLENCEICDKRFTVTAYSKEGPDGGLLCPKCSKELEEERKKDSKQKKAAVSRDKRRKTQSNLLDGLVSLGAKSLQELCVEKVADNINDVEEFGDLPPDLLDRLSQILSKRRALTSRTLDLFLRPEVDKLSIYDCANLTTEDFIRIFSIIPQLKRLDLRFAGQMKDEVLDYIMERNTSLRQLRLDAANLVTDTKWTEFFAKMGPRLESLELSWLDFAMSDEGIDQIIESCPRLQVLKLKKVFRLTDASLEHLQRMQNLTQLSLSLTNPTSTDTVTAMVNALGSRLTQLSLHRFQDADDLLLEAIHMTCRKLTRLCVAENDSCTDAAFAALFTNWSNPPLTSVNISRTRSIDNSMPDGPEEAIGLGSDGFRALMAHSGKRLERLKISSCRHIDRDTLREVFDGTTQYPNLKHVDISFVTKVNSDVVIGMFKSCPALQKVAAFCCFDVRDVVVPTGVALIGVPTAQDSIVQGTAALI